jgi:hypothetical protein
VVRLARLREVVVVLIDDRGISPAGDHKKIFDPVPAKSLTSGCQVEENRSGRETFHEEYP